MTGDKLNICISEEYAKTLGDLKSFSYQVESGVSIRNKFIFNSILSRLNKKYIAYKLITLSEKINPYKLLTIYLIPFLIFKNSNSFQACSLSLLAKLSRAFESPEISNCDIIFIHHGYSLLKYFHAINSIKIRGRPIVVLEMPENIIEVSGYLAHRRYCVNNLENLLRSYAKVVDIITSPTLRDSIYYSNVLNVPNVFTIYNVYNVFPAHFTDKHILGRKNRGSMCISTGSWCNESITKFINNIIRLLNVDDKINIVDIHILGCRKMPQYNMGGVNVHFHGKLPLKDYLDVLSKCVVTILYPRLPWSGGHSVRLNDAALMGNVILGSDHDLRGEPYKYQYTYIDERDLVAKLQWLMDSTNLIDLGMENRKIALERVKKNEETLNRLVDILLGSVSNTD
jgi:hypothetical protein